MRSSRRRIELALIQMRLAAPLGLAIAVAAVAVLICIFVVLIKPNPARFDPWSSIHTDDPGVYCRTYGEGGTVCSQVPEGVRNFRERQATVPRSAP